MTIRMLIDMIHEHGYEWLYEYAIRFPKWKIKVIETLVKQCLDGSQEAGDTRIEDI